MHIFIYPFILYRLFYFISFYSILLYLLSFIDDQNFFITFFFHLFCDNLPCSGMFRNVPECSGMFVNARLFRRFTKQNEQQTNKYLSPGMINKSTDNSINLTVNSEVN